MRHLEFLAIGLLGICATGCTTEPAGPQSEQDVRVQFRMLVGDAAFECGESYPKVGADDFDFVAADARMFVHDVTLLRKDGSEAPVTLDADGTWQRRNLALLDFEGGAPGCAFGTAEMNDTLRGRALSGEYTGIRFTLGVPFELNHQNQAVAKAPLNVTSMFWSWNAGYKFLRVDGEVEGGGSVAVHLGSTGCESDGNQPVSECKHENRQVVTLEGFDPTERAVGLDLAKLFADTSASKGFCIGDRTNPACEAAFRHLGVLDDGKIDVFRPVDQAKSLGPAPEMDAGVPADGGPVGDCQDKVPSEPYEWNLPEGFPEPPVPEDNPMSEAKVQLGRRLFYDKQLSFNGEQSCASCHAQSLSFTDGLAVSVGSTGESHRRSSMSLANVAYYARFTWANPLLDSLEEQALGPLFGETPHELGWPDQEALVERFRDDSKYPSLFEEAFGTDCDPVSLDHITKAIAAFERILISGDSPYDRYSRGDLQAMSEDAVAGFRLFNTERLECNHCHGGINLSHNSVATGIDEPLFANTGLYDVDGDGSYPDSDQGTIEVTEDARDMGMFKPPSLRNIALTAPYMHDGDMQTLDEVIDHYAAGGRAAGPNLSSFLPGFKLTAEERRQLHAFFEALTDEAFLKDPRFKSPFP